MRNRQIEPARLCNDARVLAVLAVRAVNIAMRASGRYLVATVPGIPVYPAAIGDLFRNPLFHRDQIPVFYFRFSLKRIHKSALRFAFTSRWFTFGFIDNRIIHTV